MPNVILDTDYNMAESNVTIFSDNRCCLSCHIDFSVKLSLFISSLLIEQTTQMCRALLYSHPLLSHQSTGHIH